MSLYEWHPYEMQALVCGLIIGTIFGVLFHRLWLARSQ